MICREFTRSRDMSAFHAWSWEYSGLMFCPMRTVWVPNAGSVYEVPTAGNVRAVSGMIFDASVSPATAGKVTIREINIWYTNNLCLFSIFVIIDSFINIYLLCTFWGGDGGTVSLLPTFLNPSTIFHP